MRWTGAWAKRLSQVLLILVSLLWLGPYAFMVLASLRSSRELLASPLGLPKEVNGDAYRKVFETLPIAHYLGNTLAVALCIAVLQILLCLPAGYALAKLEFRGKRAAFALVLLCLLVPAQVTFVPVFLMLARIGWVNTLAGLVVPFGVSALGTFLVRQALHSVPNDVIEAARLDGAGELRIIYQILAPMLTPTLVALFLMSFVFHYNDYFWPLIMTTDEKVRTLPLGVALLREQGSGVRWHWVMAGNVVLSAPVLLVFALTQRHLARAVAPK